MLELIANRALAREALWDACRAYDRNQVEIVARHELAEFASTTYGGAPWPNMLHSGAGDAWVPSIYCTQLFTGPALVRLERWGLRQRWKRLGYDFTIDRGPGTPTQDDPVDTTARPINRRSTCVEIRNRTTQIQIGRRYRQFRDLWRTEGRAE